MTLGLPCSMSCAMLCQVPYLPEILAYLSGAASQMARPQTHLRLLEPAQGSVSPIEGVTEQ